MNQCLDRGLQKVSPSQSSLLITFPFEAHGFRLSSRLRNRIFFYPDKEYRMDVKEIPSAEWRIAEVRQTFAGVVVKLVRE